MINILPVPEKAYQMQAALTRIQQLGSSEHFFERHLGATAATITTIFIATVDTVVYAGKALTGFLIAVIELDMSKSLEELTTNGSDALRSLTLVAVLAGFTFGGIFMPQTIFGSFPTFKPPTDYHQESVRLQSELGLSQQEVARLQQSCETLPGLTEELANAQKELALLKGGLRTPVGTETDVFATPAPRTSKKKEETPVTIKGLERRKGAYLKEITIKLDILGKLGEGIQKAQTEIAKLQGEDSKAAQQQEAKLQPIKAEIRAVCEAASQAIAGQNKQEEKGSATFVENESTKTNALLDENRSLDALLKRINGCVEKHKPLITKLMAELRALKNPTAAQT